MISELLDPITLPLKNRHLIEASAGTGKTYNITRIYVRLLLERKLSVQQILVMTFTEAATEEIRERIAGFIHELLRDIDKQPCDFSRTMQERVGKEEAKSLLQIAALELDLAAIFTIHGFCQRVISRFGLSMSVPQQASLKTDFSHIINTCVSDALLSLQQYPEQFLLLQNKQWHKPTTFIDEFGGLIGKNVSLNSVSQQVVLQSQLSSFTHFWHSSALLRSEIISGLSDYGDIFYAGLADSKKNHLKIDQEIQDALYWLQQDSLLPSHAQKDAVSEKNIEFLQDWLSGKIKDDAIVNKAFKALFSGQRVKKMGENAGIQSDHPIIVAGQNLLEQLKQVGLNSDHKKKLKDSIQMCTTFEVVEMLVTKINQKLALFKSRERVIGFDDLISTVAESLASSDTFLRDTLQEQYPAALVDEFQDTDQDQYQIFDVLYPSLKNQSQDNQTQANIDDQKLLDEKPLMLVMIGDPKQAIYSFRGGDIFTYLKAKEAADYIWNMVINYRSSANVIRAYNRIFFGKPLPVLVDNKEQVKPTSNTPAQQSCANLFNFDIEYHLIDSPPDQSNKMKMNDSLAYKNSCAMEFVFASAQRVKQISNKGRNETKETPLNQQNREILKWCALEAKRLLADVCIEENGELNAITSPDIAILVRSGKQAKLVKKVFDEYGLATVYLSEKSLLFASKHALNVLWLLQAVHTPNKASVRRALTTGLLLPKTQLQNEKAGIIQLLLCDDAEQWELVYSNLQTFKQIWQNKGIHALVQHLVHGLSASFDSSLTHANAVQPLGIQDSLSEGSLERSLSNYLHLADELAQAEISHTTAQRLLYWLHMQITEPEALETSQLRLESDQKLIKIVTQHKSKGLEYPIVFLPFANQASGRGPGHVIDYHNSDKSACTQLGWAPDAVLRYQQEQLAEDMRLLYVSMTRPVLRTYVGFSGRADNNTNALMRAVNVSIDKSQEYPDLCEYLRSQLQASLHDINDIVLFTKACDLPQIKGELLYAPNSNVVCKNKTTRIDKNWQVTSFSQIARSFSQHLTSNKEHEYSSQVMQTFIYGREAEIPTNISLLAADKAMHNTNLDALEGDSKAAQVISPVQDYAFNFPKGPQAGNYLHDLLEYLDFDCQDVPCAIESIIQNELPLISINGKHIDRAGLSRWIISVLQSPLSHNSDLCLAALSPKQSLKECEFYFELNQLDTVHLAEQVKRYRQHLAEKFDLSLSSHDFINTNVIENLDIYTAHTRFMTGAMHGFIDLIFEHNGKFYVADYKSNYLGNQHSDYSPAQLAQDIIKHDYDLQFLIYSVALHRYLQTRLIDYDYESHFGGVYYLFLRGMSNTQTSHLNQAENYGVFYDQVPSDIVQNINALFTGGDVPK